MNRMMLGFIVVAGLACTRLGAAQAADSAPPAPAVTVSGAVTGLQAWNGAVTGGQVDWSSATITGTVKRQFVPAFSASLTLTYNDEYWGFASSTADVIPSFWGRLQRPAVGLNFGLALSPTILLGIGPSAEWPAAPGVDADDALTYGATFSALKVFSPKFVLGAGVNTFRQFYNVKNSPFVIINWKLTDRLKIANAFPAGPEGGAGVELRYAPDKRWEFAGGGVWRSSRFRLADDGPYARQVGEMSCIPLFGRATRNLGAKTRVDLYAGALVNGSLKVKDDDGRDIENETWGTSPALALTLSQKF